jgi:apolipoprotein N-acyltransferase
MYNIHGFLSHPPPKTPQTAWHGIHTQYGDMSVETAFDRHIDLITTIEDHKAKVLVFPESVSGTWTPTTEFFWKMRRSDKAVLLGARRRTGQYFENGVTAVTPTGADPEGAYSEGVFSLYSQRVPVPFVMWQPLSKDGFRVHWFKNPVTDFFGERPAFFICFEQLLVWPMLHSQTNKPTLLVGISNMSWASGLHFDAVQRTVMSAWARLFSQSLVLAVNQEVVPMKS